MADNDKSQRPLILSLLEHSDIGLAVAVVVVLVTLIIPLPTVLLDILIAVNISGGMLILLVTLNAKHPLELTTFPSVLLFTTLFRLALNVASTRLILLNANAGEIISAFGNFVVGGNMVVGMVVFLILVIIQFVVITKGSGRISEVAARFTLDAMPGKQMSIDADLNAGMITEAEARERRDKITKEAEFYGAMDGASKFVRGDAIAGIIITVVNIFGGIIIGMMRNMSVYQALRTYSILTVGDGLVSQIPSLIIATASGIIVTKASSRSSLGRDISGQILSQPRSIAIAAGILAFFSIVPGMPMIPFFILASILGILYLAVNKASSTHPDEISELTMSVGGDGVGSASKSALSPPKEDGETSSRSPSETGDEVIESLLRVDRMGIEVGYRLIPLVDPSKEGGLLDRITTLRCEIAKSLGMVVPPIHIKDNMQLNPNAYSIKIKGQEVAQGELYVNHFLAIDPGSVTEPVKGIETKDPTFGMPALWITKAQKEEAELAGYTTIDSTSVLITHLSETIKNHSHEILSRQDVQTLIDNVKRESPAVVEELVGNIMSLGGIQKVLQNLLKERIPICDLTTILETLADYGGQIKDYEILTEKVRQSLARTICGLYQSKEGKIGAISLDPEIDSLISQNIHQADGTSSQDEGTIIGIEPGLAQKLVEKIALTFRDSIASGYEAVLLTSSKVRRHIRHLIGSALPAVPVLSYSEIVPSVEVEFIGVVSLADEN